MYTLNIFLSMSRVSTEADLEEVRQTTT